MRTRRVRDHNRGIAAAGQGAADGVSCDLVVFPSNRSLCLRAHGMAEATLRRHLAALVEAGLIIRRDSPNGKRYARKDATGRERFSDAFGFDLTPLVTRAGEFEGLAEELRRQARALRLTKERISLHRRDITKLIACGLDEGLEGPWEDYRQRFMRLVTPLRRIKGAMEFDELAGQLAQLRVEVANTLEKHINSQNIHGNDDQNDRHESNTNTQSPIELEPASKEEGQKTNPHAQTDPNQAEPAQFNVKTANHEAENPEPQNSAETEPPKTYPLGMVLEACPDVRDYATSDAIKTWPEFLASVRLLRPMLGISPDAWRNAIAVLGEGDAAIAVATILQRSEHSSEAARVPGEAPGSWAIAVNGSPAIKSPGGYLRALTEKARAGDFALGPILMALRGQRLKARRVA